MKVSKTLFCSSKLPWANECIYSKFTDNLDPQRGSSAPSQTLVDVPPSVKYVPSHFVLIYA
jgi:hypothetical protein